VARFEQIKALFWSNGAHGVRSALTDEMVRDAEQAPGVTLPPSLLDLLRAQNGGGVAAAWNAFATAEATSWSETHVPFDTLDCGCPWLRRTHSTRCC
jgi:hypothetical protein